MKIKTQKQYLKTIYRIQVLNFQKGREVNKELKELLDAIGKYRQDDPSLPPSKSLTHDNKS